MAWHGKGMLEVPVDIFSNESIISRVKVYLVTIFFKYEGDIFGTFGIVFSILVIKLCC